MLQEPRASEYSLGAYAVQVLEQTTELAYSDTFHTTMLLFWQALPLAAFSNPAEL